MDPGDGLLTAVTTFCKVHTAANPSDFMGQSLVICFEPEARNSGGSPECFARPGTGDCWRLLNECLQFRPGNDQLRAGKGCRARRDILRRSTATIFARFGSASSSELPGGTPGHEVTVIRGRGPHNCEVVTDIADLYSAHEAHPVEIAHQVRGGSRFGRDPRQVTVIDSILKEAQDIGA